MKTKLEKAILDSMSSNPNNYKWIFYVNPKDPRLIVPKIDPVLGRTFNFGHTWSYIALLSSLLIAIAAILLIK